MKEEQLYEAMGEIKDTYLTEARREARKRTPLWIKWGSVAASLMIVIIGLFLLKDGIWTEDLPATETTEATEETAFGTRYVYRIQDGGFAPYYGGKVIDESHIGEKLETVTVSGGWITEAGQEPADEILSGEIYPISGVDRSVAVALKFLDKGDALTTTHYYVILNPEADLSPVAEYVIPDYMPNHKDSLQGSGAYEEE